MKDNSDGLLLEDIVYGIDGGYYGIYDGIIAWKMTDGRLINRWSGVPGCEFRAAKTQRLIDNGTIQ